MEMYNTWPFCISFKKALELTRYIRAISELSSPGGTGPRNREALFGPLGHSGASPGEAAVA